jgi:Ni,Fe-hydrogenase I cytochrome b subunit
MPKLWPLWLCTYKYNTKEYGFMVNGESGKITGRYPVSVAKVIMTVLIFLLIIVAAVVIYSLYMKDNSNDYYYIGSYLNSLGSYLIG